MATYYMCDSPATSREHAPPLCFFPEQKDLPDAPNFRVDLVTVPSCPAHNSAASKDDEYALVILLSHYENSLLAEQHFGTKVVRALKRSPAFVTTAFVNQTTIVLNGQETISFQVDVPRFERVMDKTVRALYFDLMAARLLEPIKIVSSAFRRTDHEYQEASHDLSVIGRDLFCTAQRHGENPDVFYYQHMRFGGSSAEMLRMVFYEGFAVYALWGDDSAS